MATFADIALFGFVQIPITCIIPGDVWTSDFLFIMHYVLHATMRNENCYHAQCTVRVVYNREYRGFGGIGRPRHDDPAFVHLAASRLARSTVLATGLAK